MTARELVYGLQEQLLNLFGEIIYDISSTDLLYYLNKAQNQLIKEKYQLFEQTQYISDELRTLVKEVDIVPTVTGTVTKSKLPDDYSILIKHKCTTIDSNCNSTKEVPGLIVQNDDIYQLLKDPFWKPTALEPLYYILGDNIIYEIPNNDFKISNTTISYIKKESSISLATVNNNDDITSELPEFVHLELISLSRELIIQDKQLNINN